jgi:hypothetical protein
MYKLLGGTNIFLKHQIVVYSKKHNCFNNGQGIFFLFKYLGSDY